MAVQEPNLQTRVTDAWLNRKGNALLPIKDHKGKKKKFPQEAQKVTSVMSQEEATHNAKAQMQTTSHACYLKN